MTGTVTRFALWLAFFIPVLAGESGAQDLSDSVQLGGVQFNQYYDGTNVVAKTTGYSGMLYTDPVTGRFIIETGGTNTAGATVTRTPLVTVYPGGSTGIGTSSPSQRLEVNGGIGPKYITGAYYISNNKILHQPASDTTSLGVGYQSLLAQTVTNKYNTAVGYRALYSTITGASNTAIGYEALRNTRMSHNTGIGHYALLSSTSGSYNTAAGYSSAYTNTTGSYITALGRWTLANNTVGSYNTAIGSNALVYNATGDNNVAFGYYALYPTSGYSNVNNNTAIGGSAARGLTAGNNNTVIGHGVGYTNLATGSNNILIGTSTRTDTASSGMSNYLNVGNLYSGDLAKYHAAITNGSIVAGTAPTVGSGATDCGTSPAIAGNDNIMKITVGSSTNGGKCTFTFAQAWVIAPVCIAQDQTTVIPMRAPSTTTTVTVYGAIVAGDTISVRCLGYQL